MARLLTEMNASLTVIVLPEIEHEKPDTELELMVSDLHDYDDRE